MKVRVKKYIFQKSGVHAWARNKLTTTLNEVNNYLNLSAGFSVYDIIYGSKGPKRKI